MDNFIEYQVYKDCTSKSSSNSSASSDWWIMVVLAIIMGVCPPLGAIIVLGIVIFGQLYLTRKLISIQEIFWV